MLRHLFKNHFSKLDWLFVVLAVGGIALSISVGEYADIVFWLLFLTLIFVINVSNMTKAHLSDLVEKLLELVELQNKVLGGGKIVETITHEFSIERVSKKGKSNGKSSQNPSKSGRSGSEPAKKPAAGTDGKRKRANGVSDRKPKAPSKNRKK